MNLEPFNFKGHNVRILTIDGKEWWIAKDVALLLGYKNTADAIQRHCKRSKSLIDIGCVNPAPHINQPLTGLGLDPQTKLIPEGDVFRLISKCTLPIAEEFDDWLFDEVLPQIRRKGYYSIFILPEPKSWKKTFIDSFYRNVCRLKGVEYKGTRSNTHAVHVIRRMYDHLMPSDVRAEIRRTKGSEKIHQRFTDMIENSNEHVLSHVLVLLSTSNTIQEFYSKFNQEFPPYGQKKLFDDRQVI